MIYEIKRINSKKLDFLGKLAAEAESEEITFVKTTIDEWKNGINNFSEEGECFFGAFADSECIGIGGLNIDPYVNINAVGRVRHIYVSPAFRRNGIGRNILDKIIRHAEDHFTVIRLFSDSIPASHFYESYGFQCSENYKESHIMKLNKYKI